MNRLALPTIFLLCVSFALASCLGATREQVIGTAGSSPSELNGDGRYFGYVKGGTPDPPTIDFDIAEAFFGDEANRAAAEDGVVGPGEPVSNDHYERNPDGRSEPLRLSMDANVTAALPASFLTQFVTPEERATCEAANTCAHISMSEQRFFEALKSLDAEQGVPAWVTVRDGVVTRIDEQYFP